jgi:hypothetical protein
VEHQPGVPVENVSRETLRNIVSIIAQQFESFLRPGALSVK